MRLDLMPLIDMWRCGSVEMIHERVSDDLDHSDGRAQVTSTEQRGSRVSRLLRVSSPGGSLGTRDLPSLGFQPKQHVGRHLQLADQPSIMYVLCLCRV